MRKFTAVLLGGSIALFGQSADRTANLLERLTNAFGPPRFEEPVRMGVEPGDPVVPDAPFRILNGSQNYLGKGWDDRVGCGVIVEAMRRLANASQMIRPRSRRAMEVCRPFAWLCPCVIHTRTTES